MARPFLRQAQAATLVAPHEEAPLVAQAPGLSGSARAEPGRARNLWTWLASTTDLAPLGLFRIVYGLFLCYWLLQLLPDLRAFFTDEGMIPRTELIQLFPRRLTLLNLVGGWGPVFVFWLASFGAAVLLTVGWRTRSACALCFVAVASFFGRNPLILDGSDLVFRIVPFWLIFTQAGNRYSVDGWLRRLEGRPLSARGWAVPVWLLQLQVAWMYLASGIEKLGGRSWLDGTAVSYVLQLSYTFARPYSTALASSSALTHVATWATVGVELAFLPLAFSPMFRRELRLLAVLLAACLHLGILVFLNVGNFPLIMLAALIVFLPPGFVECVVGVIRPRLGVDWHFQRRTPTATGAEATLPAVAAVYPPRRELGTRLLPLAGVALAVLAFGSFATAMPKPLQQLRLPGGVTRLYAYASIDQLWDMFSPDAARTDGWLRVPARLADASELDLTTGGPISLSPRVPDQVDARWTKVAERIANVSYASYRLEYGRMYCRLRNWHLGPGEAPLERFEIFYTERTIQPPGAGAPAVRELPLWNHVC